MNSPQEAQQEPAQGNLFSPDVLQALVTAINAYKSVLIYSPHLEYAQHGLAVILDTYQPGTFVHWDLGEAQISEHLQTRLKDQAYISLRGHQHDLESLIFVKKASDFVVTGVSPETAYWFTKLLLKAVVITAIEAVTSEDALRQLAQGLQKATPQYNEAQALETLLIRSLVLVLIDAGVQGTFHSRIIDGITPELLTIRTSS
jgi:hypothetical protein